MAPSATPAPGLVVGTWKGPFVADMGPGQPVLNPGEEFHITPDLAESEHWDADPQAIADAKAHLESLNTPEEVEAPAGLPASGEQPEVVPPESEPPDTVEQHSDAADIRDHPFSGEEDH